MSIEAQPHLAEHPAATWVKENLVRCAAVATVVLLFAIAIELNDVQASVNDQTEIGNIESKIDEVNTHIDHLTTAVCQNIPATDTQAWEAGGVCAD